jgi:hypothetical protein
VPKMHVQLPHDNLEVRTRSVPTAAALLVAGFSVLRIIERPDGQQVICFPPVAANALHEYLVAKQRIDVMLEAAR